MIGATVCSRAPKLPSPKLERTHHMAFSGTAGAQWYRAALQVNPYGYVGNPSPSQSFSNEGDYNNALLDVCEAEDIRLLAITDHWKASTASGLISEAKSRGIVVLPGFEANCSEGFHLLVIFEADTDIEYITTAIGACGPPDSDPHGPASKSFVEIAAEMTRKGALVIPAHVNVATSGLLARATGKPLQNIVQSDHILSLATTPSRAAMGQQGEIFANKAPYTRRHPLVEIYADDISHPDTLRQEGATSWFKMATPSLRGLSHALRTPGTRVKVIAPEPVLSTRLIGISWNGGFLDQVSIPIGSELTALIGGRGTGKSTVIESVRFVLAQPPLGKDALKDHDSVVSKVLGAGTVVSLVVERYEPAPARYTIQRSVGSAPVVIDASGTPTQLLPGDIVSGLEAFGQHELAELAQDKEMLAALIRRMGAQESSEGSMGPLLQRLSGNRDALYQVSQREDKLEAQLEAIPRLEDQASRFDKTGLGEKLEAQKRVSEERAIFEEYQRRLDVFERQLESLHVPTLLEDLASQVPDLPDGDRRAFLEDAQRINADTVAKLDASFASIDDILKVGKESLELQKAAWGEVIAPDLEAHAATVRDLVADGYDPDTYLKTSSALQALRLRAEELKAFTAENKRLAGERKAMLTELTVLNAKLATELGRAITEANKVTRNQVNVRPVLSPDRGHIRSIIDKHFSTQRTQIMAAINADDFSVSGFVKAARAGTDALADLGITGAQARHLLEAGESLFQEIEEQSVGLAVDVYLNVASSGTEYKKLEDLSKGQRATALLLLLLGASTTPLVIDQPEDDLDNRFVFKGIVQHLRHLKGQRQVLLSTHNANVPVLGDAELVVVMESDGRRGRTPGDGIGSLDEPSIRDYAEKLLEGGEEAFRARRHLYGF
ncbi:TrlF family AAA-like ATPase [Clavibacter tessellarius]|uniref:TrlF family AAA-like ATPase n=1 Tax=Clavibacter tessellarius TaxID=31965 RepID=UPI0039E9A427